MIFILGLFVDLLIFSMNENEKFKRCADKMPRNALYTSPQIQNELIEAMTICLQKKFIDEINEADFVTILVDGTKDKHGIETLSVAFRFVNKNGDVGMYFYFLYHILKIILCYFL